MPDLVELADSLQRVGSGGTALDPEIVRIVVRPRSAPSALADLSEREREVLAWVAQCLSNTSVAHQLTLSGRTVEAHMHSISTKLGPHGVGSTHRRVLAVVAYLDVRELR